MGTELVRRDSIEELVGHRKRALECFESAYDLITDGLKAAARATPSGSLGYIDRKIPELLLGDFNRNRASFTDAMRRHVDRAMWRGLIESTDLERLMDHKARQDFRNQLHEDPPEATAENVFATLQGLIGNSDMIFKRGVAEAFSSLDRRFRSHDGFKIGSRIALERAFNEHGIWNHYRKHDEVLRDVERAFFVLDEREVPARYAGIVGVIDETKRNTPGAWLEPRAFTCETEYFEARAFKNGNLHIWFKRKDLLERVNKLLADYYGAALGTASPERKHEPKREHAKGYGFFPTPQKVVEEIISESGVRHRLSGEGPFRVLEPSAGNGAIARAAVEAGAKVVCIEVQQDLADGLKSEGIYDDVHHADFFDRTPEPIFDFVLMNPPFDGQRDIDHVTHAFGFLKPGGRLVAITSAGVAFRENAKAVDFRKMIEANNGRIRDLPSRSFEESGTLVNTCIVTMRKR